MGNSPSTTPSTRACGPFGCRDEPRSQGSYYHPSRHSAGQPVVAGCAYRWIARLGFAREGWVAFVDVERVRPTENANAVAVEQVRGLLGRSPDRDAGYDPVRPQRGLKRGLPRGGPPRA